MIDKEALAKLVPHAGSMCLLDVIEAWDEDRILCYSCSHRDPANPLSRDGYLSAVHALEYGAQAIAAHGGLLAGRGLPHGAYGYLAALREVALHVERLDDIEAALHIEARRLASLGENVSYLFRVRADGRLLAEGRATIVIPPPEQW